MLHVVDEDGGDGDEGCECTDDGKDEEDDIKLDSVTLK